MNGRSRIPSISIFDTIVKNPPEKYHAVPYDAVSYTWGDSQDEERILIRYRNPQDNNRSRPFIVRKNCADVLRQLSRFATSQFYWIDAICINQADEKEREEQVILMSDIFGRARCVLACVGMHQDDSDFLAHMLDGFDGFLAARQASIRALTVRATQSGKIPWITASIPENSSEATCAQHCFEWVKKLDTPTTERFFKALDQFAKRPYFWRIWILQELCLADQVRFFCGDSELKLSTLLFWWRDAKAMTLNHRDRGAQQPNGTSMMTRLIFNRLGPEYLGMALWRNRHYFYEHGGSGLGSSFEDMLYERQTPRRPGQDYNRRLMAIPDILKMCEYRQCQDPRDCVFGTLALGNWRSSIYLCKGGFHVHVGETIRPDYKTPAFSLALSLLPGFHDTPQLNRLVMGMLGLSYTDRRVQEGLKDRYRRSLNLNDMPVMPPRRINNDAQRLVHMVEGGIQLCPGCSWSTIRRTTELHEYTQVLDAKGRCCAITSAPIKPGDWLIPTNYGRGFVLRRWGTLYAVVGKAYCPPDLWPEDLELTAFMMWYDPEDLLVHVVGGLRGLESDDIDPPSKEMIDHLQIGLCADENTSFGQLPSRQRRWSASDFAYDTLGTCETIVRDCYEDNDYYWFC